MPADAARPRITPNRHPARAGGSTRVTKRLRLVLAVSALLTTFAACATEAPFDVIIANGHVIDGSGSPWFAADVGIRAGKIAAIGKLDGAQAKRRIDAAGKVVAPGFIDMLGQSELTILVDPRLPTKI